jgi:hypothetical protein
VRTSDQLGPEDPQAGHLGLHDAADLPFHVLERGASRQDHLNARPRPTHRLADAYDNAHVDLAERRAMA